MTPFTVPKPHPDALPSIATAAPRLSTPEINHRYPLKILLSDKHVISVLLTQHKLTKSTLSKLILYLFTLLILTSSTCFKYSGPSSGRQLFLQL